MSSKHVLLVWGFYTVLLPHNDMTLMAATYFFKILFFQIRKHLVPNMTHALKYANNIKLETDGDNLENSFFLYSTNKDTDLNFNIL